MVYTNDPAESFFNSMKVMKDSLSPLEVGIRKAVKDLEHCLLPKNKGKGVCLIAQVKEGGEFQICDVKKNKKKNNIGSCFVDAADERKKGLSIKVPLKAFFGMFSQNSWNDNKGQVVKENGQSCTNCFHFAMTWSFLVNGFLQAIPSPFKSGRKKFQITGDEDKPCSCMKPPISSFEVKQSEMKVKENGVWKKDEKHVSLECLVGFIFDQLSHTLQSIDQL